MSIFPQTPIVLIVAANLKDAMERRKDRFPSIAALAKESRVAPNTIKNMLYPKMRAPTAKGESGPNIEKLDAVAKVLGMQTWELLYPSAQAESDMNDKHKLLMDKIRESFAELERLDKERQK